MLPLLRYKTNAAAASVRAHAPYRLPSLRPETSEEFFCDYLLSLITDIEAGQPLTDTHRAVVQQVA
jgi:hypothetical protein